ASVRALDPTRLRLDGQLVLRGVQRPCGSELRLTSNPGTWVASFELVPSTFGIRPYRALAGAIRVADRVQVRVELTLGDAEPSALLAAQTPTRFTGSLAGPRVR
ncbi:MAG TPA: YceI family protein, partial [Polyangiales bacterium]|nr:YceI family protein [Polyangiales bacterium]